MTKVDFHFKFEKIVKVKVSGHSNFAAAGEDIVCSSISTLAFSVINFLEKNNKFNYQIDEKATIITLEMKENDPEVESYFNYLLKSYEIIEKDYPKNLKIRSIYD